MAYVTKEDGIRDFNAHDAAGYFKYIDRMVINSDFTLTRIPKDPNNPGLLDLNSTWKMAPAYVNGYVDAFNLKYLKVTPSSYQVVESAKNNYPLTADQMVKNAILEANKFAVSDNTGIGGGIVGGTRSSLGPAVVDPISGKISTPDAVARNLQNAVDNDNQKKSMWTYIILGAVALLAFWWFKRKKRR